MRKNAITGEETPETFIEAWTIAKEKANEAQEPVLYAGFYVKPDKPQKRESLLSMVLWLFVFISSCFWGPPLFTWLFGTP